MRTREEAKRKALLGWIWFITWLGAAGLWIYAMFQKNVGLIFLASMLLIHSCIKIGKYDSTDVDK